MEDSKLVGGTNPALIDAHGKERYGEPSAFKITNNMTGKRTKLVSNGRSVEQLLEDYEAKLAEEGTPWKFDWEAMAIAVSNQNMQEYHQIPQGAIISLTEGKNTSGAK